MRALILFLTVSLCPLALAAQPKTMGELAQQAVQQSKLTLPGNVPFHLKATIAEKDSPDSDYRAEVEEYWVAPDKWRRTIKTPDFAQLRIVNGDRVREEDTGDYFPHWLQDFMTALTDPLPMADALAKASNPVHPGGSNCINFSSRVGGPPATNSVFYVICFDANQQLESVVTPTYTADFKNYKPFENKRIARLISDDPEPGTHIEARITELSKLSSVEENMFAIDVPTSLAAQIRTFTVPEDAARKLVSGPAEIHWPTVRDGKTKGTLSVLVAVDREGKVRETWGLNSDNPWMTDAARKQLMDWKFTPALMKGLPIQMETILTFAFDTNVENPFPVLNNEDGRKQAIHIVEPTFRPGTAPSGAEFVVRVSVDEEGKVMGLLNINNVPGTLLMAANTALHDWKFKPLVKHGKPTEFHTDLKFRVP